MPRQGLHRFQYGDRYYALDPETCFCFECDDISWDVLELYPHTPVNHIYHLLQDRHPLRELQEVVSELEWLRASKSILSPPRDHSKDLQVARGLQEIHVAAPGTSGDVRAPRKTWWAPAPMATPVNTDDIVRRAAQLLLARSGAQRRLSLEIWIPPNLADLTGLVDVGADALRQARLAGKELTVALRFQDLAGMRPDNLRPHRFTLRAICAHEDALRNCAERLPRHRDAPLAKLPKILEDLGDGVESELVVTARHEALDRVVESLDRLGFRRIQLDLDHAFLQTPPVDPARLFQALHENALYYVASLLRHRYFRVEPFAGLFARIHNGEILPRSDPAGTNALAIDVHGSIYPSPGFWNMPAFNAGSVLTGIIDEAKLGKFDDLGVITTSACARCWARNLCGGGASAVHQALTGSFSRPAEAWCDAQRVWLAAAIAAFNQLATAGVNFSRIHQNLGSIRKPSFFAAARAAFSMQLGVRPAEESDAEWLQQWENWSEAAYFTATEYGLLLATRYDREMDALHPRGMDRELVLVRTNGEPMGLLRLRPERLNATARVWLYLRNPKDYTSESIRKSLRSILQEAAQQQEIRRLIVPVGPADHGLEDLLRGLGFQALGSEREAVFLHARYRDLQLFLLDFS